jgi:hypothetical protein
MPGARAFVYRMMTPPMALQIALGAEQRVTFGTVAPMDA